VLEIVRKQEPATLSPVRIKTIRELWRDKPPKLAVPSEGFPSETAGKIVELDPENVDVVYARNGETLRFNGLAFARVRSSMGTERAWFGIGKSQRILNAENTRDLSDLTRDLRTHR